MKKKLAWALVLVTAMTALSGCGEKKEEGSGIITGDYSAIENSSSSEENSCCIIYF